MDFNFQHSLLDWRKTGFFRTRRRSEVWALPHWASRTSRHSCIFFLRDTGLELHQETLSWTQHQTVPNVSPVLPLTLSITFSGNCSGNIFSLLDFVSVSFISSTNTCTCTFKFKLLTRNYQGINYNWGQHSHLVFLSFIGISFLYNAVLVSAIPHHESAIRIPISPSSHLPIPSL